MKVENSLGVLRVGDLLILTTISCFYGSVYCFIAMTAAYNAFTSDEHSSKSFCAALISEFIRHKNTYFAVALHILDQASDFEACAEYWREWQEKNDDDNDEEGTVDVQWWFLLSVLILFTHRVVSTMAIWIGTRSKLNTFLQLLDLALVRAVFEGHMSQRKEPGNVQRHLQSIEAIFESFPQLILSLVYLLRVRRANLAIIIQALFSIFTLALRICADDASFFPRPFRKSRFKCGKIYEQNGWRFPWMNGLWFSRVFLFRVPEIVQRVTVLSLFWSVVGGEFIAPLLLCDFIICKCLSKWLSETDSRCIRNLKSMVQWRTEPYTLDMNYLSPDFYHYLLCFKFGFDAFEVWLFVRPLMSFCYVSTIIFIALWPSTGSGRSKGTTLPGYFEASLTVCALVGCFTPFLFQWICDHTPVSNEEDAGLNANVYFNAMEIMTGRVSKRDLTTAISERRWDIVAEMVRFGADPNHVVSLMSDEQILIMMLEGCEPMEEFIAGVDYLTPQCCGLSVCEMTDYRLSLQDRSTLIERDEGFRTILFVILRRKGNTVDHDIYEDVSNLNAAQLAIGDIIIDLVNERDFDFKLPLNSDQHLGGEWDKLLNYLILRLDWDRLARVRTGYLHHFSVLFDYAVQSQSSLPASSLFSKPLGLSPVALMPFNPLCMEMTEWLRVCFVLFCHLQLDHIEDTHWVPVLSMVSDDAWFNVLESHFANAFPPQMLADILFVLLDRLHVKLESNKQEFESEWVIRASPIICRLINRSDFELLLPFNHETHFNGEWDAMFAYLVDHLDWVRLMSFKKHKLGLFTVIIDFTVRGMTDIHSLRFFESKTLKLKGLEKITVIPVVEMDLTHWLRIVFVLCCHLQMDKIEDSYWLNVLCSVPINDWFKALNSEIMGFFPPQIIADILDRLLSEFKLRLDAETFESSMTKCAKLMSLLILRSDFKLKIPFSREKHLNGEWDLLLDTLIDELNLDVLIHRDNPDITPISILFDYSVRDFIDFSHGKGIIPLTSFSVDFQMRFYPEQMTDRRGWLRLCFIAFSGNSPQSVGSKQWSALVSSIPSKVWCSAVSSMFKGWFIHTRSWIWESLAHCNPSVIFELFDQFADDWTEIADSDDHFVLRAHSEHKVTIPMSDELLTFWQATVRYLCADGSAGSMDEIRSIIQDSAAHQRVFVRLCAVYYQYREHGSIRSEHWRSESSYQDKSGPLQEYIDHVDDLRSLTDNSSFRRKYPYLGQSSEHLLFLHKLS